MTPYRAEHYFELGELQVAQRVWETRMSREQARSLEGPYASTVMEDGVPLGCGGIMPIWENRGFLWSFLGHRASPRNFRRIHGFVRDYIEAAPFRRVEAAVEVGFEAGHRWVQLLGFECETPTTIMRAFQADGTDCLLYAKVKDA